MSRKFIPIIGTISAGKSTFLDGLLGIDSLQTGVLTTTKFVCLIQNSPNISFYHVVLKKGDSGIVLEKAGEAISDKEDITEKIKEINQEFENKTVTSDDLFYMLETPINNIKNEALLNNCYFMDIPGLNEHGAKYIDNIFSIIAEEDILFEIIVFDAKSIGQQNIIDIFQNLENKKVLKKEKNMYILNKIDKYTKGENAVEAFQRFFYETFEDEKKENKITINFNNNYFIPLNSLLYQAETKYETDFYSMLLKELFIYLDSVSKTTSESFSDCLEKRVECIIKQNNINADIFDDEIDELKKDDKEIIKKSVNDIKNITGLNTTQETTFELNLSNKEVKTTLNKLYIIHKKKLNRSFSFSQSYYDIEDAINSYLNELDGAPPIQVIKEDIKKKKSLELLQELQSFISKHLAGQFGSLDRSLNCIIENLVERKIRLSFIGNISVGKSTVLNCIIGEDILPSKDAECTYRGVIIKHRELKKPQLWRAQMTILCEGTGSDYFKFEEKEMYCEGIEKIQGYLNNKNNDKQFDNRDMFIVIHARLKIFDFVKLDEKYRSKIEFVDLPGHNRKENHFINKIGDGISPYDIILKFTNSCVFINQHDSIDDDDSVKRLQAEYLRNKEKLDIRLKQKSLETSIFLINKCDELSKKNREKEKNKIKEKIFKIIGEVEENIPKNWDNVSFFSGKCFKEFLSYHKNFIEKIENNPVKLLLDIQKELSGKWFYSKDFKNFIIKKIGEIQEKLELNSSGNDSDDEDDNKIQVPPNFQKMMNSAFDEFRKKCKVNIKPKEEKDIIEKLYELFYQMQNKDFSNTNFSHLFFQKIKDIIIISDNVQNEILKIEMDNFFQSADQLFDRNIEDEKAAKENEKENIRNQYELFKNKVIPDIQRYLENKKKSIRQIISASKSKCVALVEDEINNAEDRLKAVGKDPAKASSILEEKIKEEYNNMVSKQTEETKTIINDIVKLSNKAIETHYQQSSLTESEIGVEKQKSFGIVKTLLTGALGGASAGIGLAVLGSTVAASVAAGTMTATAMTTLVGSFFGPLGIVAGLGVGAVITTVGFLIGKFTKKKKYVEALGKTKDSISQKFDDIDSAFINNFDSFKNKIVNEMKVKNEVLLQDIANMPIPDWNRMRQEYKERKADIQAKLIEELKTTF